MISQTGLGTGATMLKVLGRGKMQTAAQSDNTHKLSNKEIIPLNKLKWYLQIFVLI